MEFMFLFALSRLGNQVVCIGVMYHGGFLVGYWDVLDEETGDGEWWETFLDDRENSRGVETYVRETNQTEYDPGVRQKAFSDHLSQRYFC